MSKVNLPRSIYIGENVQDVAGEVCKGLKIGRKCLVLCGERTKEILGDSVIEDLKANGFKVRLKLFETPEISRIEKLIKYSERFSFIMGIGGGTIIDIAKYTSFRNGVPFVSVPTVASHDGISSPRATLMSNGHKFSYEAQEPMAILADTNVIAKSPYRFTASGYADLISNITAIYDWRLSHDITGEDYSEYAATLSLLSAQIVLKKADAIKNLEQSGIKILVESLINSGLAMCIAGSSRPASGSEHLFSHALDVIDTTKKSMHGEQCGVGTIISAYMQGLEWQAIKAALQMVGAPTTAAELGVTDEIAIKALLASKDIRKERYTILNKIDLNEGMARKILTETQII